MREKKRTRRIQKNEGSASFREHAQAKRHGHGCLILPRSQLTGIRCMVACAETTNKIEQGILEPYLIRDEPGCLTFFGEENLRTNVMSAF